METAFIETYFGIRAEARFTHVSDVPTSFGNFNINVTGAAQSIDFGVKLAEIVGLRLNAIVSGLIGTNIPSLVYDGATYGHGFGVQVPVRLFRIESSGSQLSLVPLFNYASGQVATLFPLFRERPMLTLQTVLQGNTGELISTPVKATRFGMTAAFAQALSPYFGLQAVAGLGGTVCQYQNFQHRHRRNATVKARPDGPSTLAWRSPLTRRLRGYPSRG